jgi:hypothetical protein
MKTAVLWTLSALSGVALGGLALWWRESPTAVVSAPGLSVREGSRLTADGRLQPGRTVRTGALAARAAERAGDALAIIPLALRPPVVTLDITPSYADGAAIVSLLEYAADSRSIVVGEGALDASRGVWLHELAHVRTAGARPGGPLGRRLLGAIDEGVADYFAAALGADPVLGAGAQQRDLRRPPRVAPSEWASLAFEGFDTHRLGWRLAALLYDGDPQGGSLLRDAVACLDGESPLAGASDSPAAVVAAFLGACPAAGRARLARILSEWLPPELLSPEIPT